MENSTEFGFLTVRLSKQDAKRFKRAADDNYYTNQSGLVAAINRVMIEWNQLPVTDCGSAGKKKETSMENKVTEEEWARLKEEHPAIVTEFSLNLSVSDGSTASYYELPDNATELQHLISYKNMNAQMGEIFRSCYRYGIASHSDQLRDAKKIKFYIDAEIERLKTWSK